MTDLNFPGTTASEKDLAALSEKIMAIAPDTDWFIFPGSLPPGLLSTAYHDLIKPLQAQGKRIVLDTSGDALQAALPAKPDVIKPNVEELSVLLGQALTSKTEIVEAARQLVNTGIETVVVSMGGEGALFVTAQAAIHAYAQPPEIKSAVGAGDAMVAGIVAGLSQRPCSDGEAIQPLINCAQLATAFSITALGQLGARFPIET